MTRKLYKHRPHSNPQYREKEKHIMQPHNSNNTIEVNQTASYLIIIEKITKLERTLSTVLQK